MCLVITSTALSKRHANRTKPTGCTLIEVPLVARAHVTSQCSMRQVIASSAYSIRTTYFTKYSASRAEGV